MKHIQQFALLAATLAAALAMPVTRAGAFAGDNVAATTDPGFVPNSGQINRGFDEKLPSSSQPRPIPTPAQARAAKMTPDSNQPSPGPARRQCKRHDRRRFVRASGGRADRRHRADHAGQIFRA